MGLSLSFAYAYMTLCIGVALFQIALIAGAPWGKITQGGRYEGPLPVSGRIAAAASIVVILVMGLSVISAADTWPEWPRWTGFVALAVQALSCIANWITPSSAERRIWGPITSLMLGLAAAVVFQFVR